MKCEMKVCKFLYVQWIIIVALGLFPVTYFWESITEALPSSFLIYCGVFLGLSAVPSFFLFLDWVFNV